MAEFRGKPRFALFILTTDATELHGPCCFSTAILGPMGESVAEFANPALAAYVCDLLNEEATVDKLEERPSDDTGEDYFISFEGLELDMGDDDDEPN